jgi:hypothetical protein
MSAMSATISRCAVLVVALTLLAGMAGGQDPAAPKKRIPTLSNDNLVDRDSGDTSAPADTVVTLAEGRRAPGMPAGWARYSPDECGLSIALPGKPQIADLPIPDLQSGSARTYVYTDSTTVIVTMHAIVPTGGPIRAGAESFLKGIEAYPRVSDMKYSIDPGTGPRLGIKANYLQNGVPLGLEGFVEVHDKNWWLVSTMYRRASPEALAFTRKVLASAKFDGPPCNGK